MKPRTIPPSSLWYCAWAREKFPDLAEAWTTPTETPECWLHDAQDYKCGFIHLVKGKK